MLKNQQLWQTSLTHKRAVYYMHNLFSLWLFAIATTFTPGPNNIMIMSSGMNFGVKRTLPMYFGMIIGYPLMIVSVALGLGALFTQYNWLQQGLKIVGSCYMLYLAYKIMVSHSKPTKQEIAKPITAVQSFLFQWLNPKAWLIAIGAVSMFSTVASHYLADALVLGSVFLAIGVPNLACWMAGGALLQRLLKDDWHRQLFNYVMGILLIVSIVIIFIH
jgi:threonine/homoserine/homoserine lactone efflux protein